MKLDAYLVEIHQEREDKYHTQHIYLPTVALTTPHLTTSH